MSPPPSIHRADLSQKIIHLGVPQIDWMYKFDVSWYFATLLPLTGSKLTSLTWMSIGNACILNLQQLLFYMLGPISQQKGRKMWKKMTRKAWKILKIAKTLIFRNWWFWNTLRVRCFIQKIFFEISWYFNIFDVSTLRNGHLWPKRSILGGQKWAKMP